MAGDVEAHVIVSGRVQGVWFRGNTQRAAAAAGVHGWVRNLPDRRVEAVLQGERAAVPAGQGARIRHGSRPEVSPLPQAPEALDPGDGAAVTVRPAARAGEPVLAWSAVAGATSYEVVVARDADFRQVALRLQSPVPRLALRGTLAPGDYRWRVTARDGRGFSSPPSGPRRLRVVEKPPRLEVESPVWR